ncbi:MAG: glycogen synthase [Actinobacteria bacterium]|nr:MAG: glycogen synthase [Actinomycetota bacterium]
MRLLLAAAEFSPLVRTGGLGEAVAGLAGALFSAGNEVTVAIPGYRSVEPRSRKVRGKPWREVDVPGPSVVAFEDELFDRPGVYGEVPGTAYADNWERFAAFALAVADLADGYEILHLHDAHVGIAALVAGTPSVFTIHNASYPLLAPLAAMSAIDALAPSALPNGPLEWFGQANYLKAGIVGAAAVTTVSPTHAVELADDATSFGLGGVIRGLPAPIVGILNGIDTGSWDPMTDPALEVRFDATDAAARRKNKRALLAEVGLDDGFVLGNVGRMAVQKGLQLLDYDIDALIAEGARLVFVGNGELDAMVDGWAARNRRAVAHLPFDERLSRRLSAGADAYLMPSQYEPCGIGQMYAMRYGAPPIAHAVGGLADTVIDVDEDAEHGTGFTFRSFDHPSLTKTIRRAIRYHARLPELWETIRRNGATADWSWRRRAEEYEAVYRSVLA